MRYRGEGATMDRDLLEIIVLLILGGLGTLGGLQSCNGPEDTNLKGYETVYGMCQNTKPEALHVAALKAADHYKKFGIMQQDYARCRVDKEGNIGWAAMLRVTAKHTHEESVKEEVEEVDRGECYHISGDLGMCEIDNGDRCYYVGSNLSCFTPPAGEKIK